MSKPSLVSLCCEGVSLTRPYPSCSSAAAVAEAVRPFYAGADRECFAVLMLDTRNRARRLHVVSVGTLNASLVHPREVFRPALVAETVAGLVLVHNHPSGESAPSQDDLTLTKRLIEAGELLGVSVLDHIIMGDGEWTSLRQQVVRLPWPGFAAGVRA